jgi:hypothetical protein
LIGLEPHLHTPFAPTQSVSVADRPAFKKSGKKLFISAFHDVQRKPTLQDNL